MSSGQSKEISTVDFYSFQEKANQKGLTQSYLPESHQMEFSLENKWMAKVSIPWIMKVLDDNSIQKRDDYHMALVMIRAGIATTGYFHDGALIDHKVFRAYMVRQKQGKSQIKYLKTKGKSRAGSRIRLGESELFFEEINERLNQYASNYPIDHWGISCSKTLWPYFFGAATPPPFDKKQDNLLGIPFHVQHPDFETLQLIHKKLNAFHILFSEEGEKHFSESEVGNSSPEEESEDW